MEPQFIILAAGMGTRLGRELPKSLTALDNGETIMARQIRNIRAAFGRKAVINVVVGYRLEEIIETFPDEKFIYNEKYDSTNTSKSLLRALRSIKTRQGVVWMNGDVVFDEDLLFFLKKQILEQKSIITVNSGSVAEEEVKYTTTIEGNINKLSKIIPFLDANGEAVGINYVTPGDIDIFTYWLNQVEDNDFFEKAIEKTIQIDKMLWKPFDITILGLSAIEVDFIQDLEKVNSSAMLD